MYLIYFVRYLGIYTLGHYHLKKGKNMLHKRKDSEPKDWQKAVRYGRKMVKHYSKWCEYANMLDELQETICKKYPDLKD